MTNSKRLVSIGRGLGAGLAATVVLSLLMVMKQAMGLMPQLNPVAMLTQMLGAHTPAAGWIAHFVIGAVIWGAVFSWLDSKLPYAHWVSGILFATGAWLMMMIIVMPMAGMGLFGLQLGVTAPIATLVMHWIYGAILGGVYGAGKAPAHAEDAAHRHAQSI
jgi:hypothetical protein